MTLTAKPPTFDDNFHFNLLLWLALHHPHLTIRKIANHLYYRSEAGESDLVFPEGELRKYCGTRLGILKRNCTKQQLAIKLDEEFDPFESIQDSVLLTTPTSSSHPPTRPSPHQRQKQKQQHQKETMSGRSPHRSPHRTRTPTRGAPRGLPKEPEDKNSGAAGLEEAFQGLEVDDGGGFDSVRYHDIPGGNSIRVYRGTVSDDVDDPTYTVDVVKARLSLIQSNLLATGNGTKLNNSIQAKIIRAQKNKSTKKTAKPLIAVGIPSCINDFDLKNGPKIQALEDDKFGMNGTNLHQQESADMISMRHGRTDTTFMNWAKVELPLYEKEEIDNSLFNGDQLDDSTLKVVVSIPNAKKVVPLGTTEVKVPVAFVSVVAVIKNTYSDLKVAKDDGGEEAEDKKFDEDQAKYFADDDDEDGVDPPEEGRDDFPPNNEEPTVVSNTDQSTRVDTHLLEQQMQDNTEFDNFEDNTNDEAPPPGGWNGEVWDYKLKPKGDARVEPSNNAKGMFNSFFQNLAGAAAATSNNGMNVDDTQDLDAAAAAAKVASAESNGKPASTSNHDFMDTHEVFIKEKLIQGGGKNKKQKVVMEKGMTSLAAAAAADERAATETELIGFFDEDL